MGCDPVTGRQLDPRYEQPILDGPSWERLCDALKYSSIREMGVEFAIADTYGKAQLVFGRVCGIDGSPGSPDLNPTIKFIPASDCSSHPIPMEMNYYPSRRLGHAVDVSLRLRFNPTPSPVSA